MTMPFLSGKDVVVFDLDDTLYKEVDYLVSAYRKIENLLGIPVAQEMFTWWRSGQNPFECLIEKYHPSMSFQELLDVYRYHEPVIKLTPDASLLLDALCAKGIPVGIISDGRSRTQRNKIKALGLEWIEDVIISEEFGSEKPSEANYRYFMDQYPGCHYTYIADNVKKDFVTPNRLGWNTVCLLDDGRNIHKQDFHAVGKEYLASSCVHMLDELTL